MTAEDKKNAVKNLLEKGKKTGTLSYQEIMDTLEEENHSESVPLMIGEWMRGDEGGGVKETYYRVQVGAFSNRENAENLLNLLLADGLPAFLLYQNGLFKVQVGAFVNLTNAINMERKVREMGYNTYITT